VRHDSLQHTIKHSPRRQQVLQRPERPCRWRVSVALQIRPFCRDKEGAAVLKHQDQLQLAPAAHPARQPERAALKRVACPHNTDRRREAIEVGSVSCLLSIAFSTTL
jgi:hypothetical protein